ncbi:uncharacterized protein KY384_006897 [Bacidia gigantensis]|uniref:uncharacterized protein n=1 Tax=Bacidia gigantensis TaxID=2732470 RepID=UPI001D04E608|nr:uncharacterized protein KY384_006897 [Bacidia gigantensis]KAG8527981.1 hypothetical protein KY384_006897 [Bacidia gigantensis]
MARKAKQELAVDGTAKLAAKAKPGDKHEKPNLNIEEATVASPRESRKRTGDFHDFEEDDEDGNAANSASKSATAKTTQPKKKAKTTSSAGTSKPAKQKSEAKESKKPKAKAKEAGATDQTIGARVKAETDKPAKAKKEKKGKTNDKAIVIGPSGDTAQVNGPTNDTNADVKDKTPKSQEETSKPKKEPKLAKEKSATKKASDKPTKTKKADKKGTAEITPNAESGSKDAAPEVDAPASKAKKPRKDTKAVAPAEPADDSATAMDQEPFEKLLDTAKDKEVQKTKTPKTKKDAEKPKKASKVKEDKTGKKEALATKKDNAKKTSEAAETAPTKSKSKKRKASATADPETVKSDILDPLAEHASSSKKQKKDSRKSIGETVGELVNTGLEAAAQGANSLKESFGGLTDDAFATLTDKTPEVTSNLGKAGEAAAKIAAKGKGKSKEAVDTTKSALSPPSRDGEDNLEDDVEAEESDLDEQTAALIKGFESGDDEPAGDNGAIKGGYEEGQKMARIPKTKTTEKALKALKDAENPEPGVAYIGRIPHGFYEKQMQAYFGQFGTITKLRLSRSRKSGKSKHYAFIEFENIDVAKIVVNTMQNYLLYDHILKLGIIPKENQHWDMWKGANKHFKSVPWSKIEGRKLEMPLGKSQWQKKNAREEKKRESKAEKLKDVMEYEFEAPKLRDPEDVLKAKAPLIGEGQKGEVIQQEQSVITAVEDVAGGSTTVVSETIKTKKVKKDKKEKSKKPKEDKKENGEKMESVVTGAKRALEGAEEGVEKVAPKAKKAKKAAKQADDA